MIYNYYTDEDIFFIQENYRELSYKKIGIKLNRTPDAIRRKIISLGIRQVQVRLKEKRPFIKWSKKDILYVRDNYLTKTDKSIAEHLGKRKQDIGTMRDKLGLTKHDKIVPKYKQVKEVDYEKREKIYSNNGVFCINKYQSMYF